jgi:protein associated with RNAse G/E
VNQPITVIKRNAQGVETWRYMGELLAHQGSQVVLQAFFDREDTRVDGMLLTQGDRFIETYYTDRWYNIFEIRAHTDDRLRGWYCNVGKPAVFEAEDVLSYVDLALDLLVFPDGRQVVLDEDEFAALNLPPEVRRRALGGLRDLQARFFNQFA